MKLKRSSTFSSNQGSVLLVAIGTVVVLGIILAAILSLIAQERRILARTSSWNAALPVAEAGIEEAMSHLRQVDGGARNVNGWTLENTNYVMSRYLAEGRYKVAINGAAAPIIMSEGEVYCTNAQRYIKRTVMVTTTNSGPFHVGMVAKRRIAVGGSFSIDSFDSSTNTLSTNGKYDQAKRNDKGGVASNSSDPGAITISGSTKVYGSLSTGPTGTVVIANNPSVGSESWVDSGKKDIEAGYYSADMNLSFDSVNLPYTSGMTPQGGKINGVTYKYVLLDGVDYQLSTLDIKGSDYMYVSGKARLLVDKDIKANGGGIINIGTNASLEVYVKKGDVSLSSSSVVNNTGKAASFSLFALNAVTDITMQGGFIGTIYAPNSTLKLNGGGEISGAVVVAEISARGNYNFHFDEALLKYKPKEYIITSWVEL